MSQWGCSDEKITPNAQSGLTDGKGIHTMKRLFLLGFLFASTLVWADAHKTAGNSTARKTLESQYSSYRNAMLRRDTPAIMKMLTEDFTWHLLDGKVLSRRQTQDELRGYFGSVKSVEDMTITVQKLTVHGNTATALVTEKVTAVTQDEKKPVRTTTTERYREHWLKTREGWKIQRTHVLKP
jgi:ketosteroid isomerase-like protein